MKSYLLLLPMGVGLAASACSPLGGPEGDGLPNRAGDACGDDVACEGTTGSAGGPEIPAAFFDPSSGITSDADPVGQPQGLIPACGNVPEENDLVGSDFAFAPTRGYVSAGHVAALLLRDSPVLPDPRTIRTADFVNMYGAPVDETSKASVSVVSLRGTPNGEEVLFDVETSVPIPVDRSMRPPANAVVLFAESASLLGSDHGNAFGLQKDAVRSLVSGFIPADRVWLAGWGSGFRVALQDSPPDKVEPALETFTKPSSSGKLETAIDNGVSLLRQRGDQGHVFVFFDGTVPASGRLDNVLKSARNAGVLVHALVVNESGYFDRVGVERIEKGGGASLFLSRENGGFDVLATRSDELFARAFSSVEGTLFHPDTFVPVLPDTLDNGVGEATPVGPGRFVTARHVFRAPAGESCNATFALAYAFDKTFQASDLPDANTVYSQAAATTEDLLVTPTRVEAIQRVVAFLKLARSGKREVVAGFAERADEAIAAPAWDGDPRMEELRKIFCSAVNLAGVVDRVPRCSADAGGANAGP